MGLMKFMRNRMPEAIPAPGAIIYNAIPAKILRKPEGKIASDVIEHVESGTIIDLGSGTGYLAIEIAKMAPKLKVHGIDLSKEMIRIARRHGKGIKNVHFELGNAAELSFENESIDFIISTGSLHHWRRPAKVFDECYRVLKNGKEAWIYDGCSGLPKEQADKIIREYGFLRYVFSKQNEFQTLVSEIQTKYVREKGWSSEWFLDTWPHITKPQYEHLNLSDAVKHTVEKWERRHESTFPWHFWRGIRSSRNLHSSQVLGLTLLGAFTGNNIHILELILLSLGLLKRGEVVLESDFEYEPPNFFNESRRTAVDFMVKVGKVGEVGTPIYFEVKFLEASFGQCSRKSRGICNGLPEVAVNQLKDQCQLTKEGIRYWESVPEIVDLSIAQQGCGLQGPFYQLTRNILHLVHEKGRALIVLSDARTKYLDEEVIQFVYSLTPRYCGLVYRMKFQQLVPYLSQVDRSLVELMAIKYGIR